MTNLAASFLLLFFVVSSSQARDLTGRSEYELSVPDSAEESDSTPSIKKFSEIEASKSTTDLDQVRTEVTPSEITAFDATATGSDPEFVLTFRHIGRRGRRGFHHRHNFKRWRSYGNDMIVSDERSSRSSVARWGSDREIAEFRGESEEDRKHFHHRHHFHHRGEEEEEEHKHKHEHKEKSGFVRNLRKFLKQFEF